MELEGFKDTWSTLDNRLKKQETLKENIIKEILQSKSGKALNRLINYTYLGIVICLIITIPIVYRMTSIYFGAFKTSIFIIGIVMLLIAAITGIYNVILLNKIDFSKEISHNLKFVECYNIRIKKQLAGMYALAFVFIVLVIIASILSSNMELWRWIAIISIILIGAVLAVWEYKRVYKLNIDSILTSLRGLKELEEDK